MKKSELSPSEQEIERLRLEEVLDLLRQSEELGEEHLPKLSAAPLPVLIRLVEEHFHSTRMQYPPAPSIRPVTLLRITSRIDRGDSQREISNQLQTHLHSRISENRELLPLSIACDSWGSWENLPRVLELLQELLSHETLSQSLRLIGPSSAEVQMLTEEAPLETILTLFDKFGIRSIDGGSQIEIHEAGALKKFSITYGQDISDLIESSTAYSTVSHRTFRAHANPLEERLGLEILVLQRRVGGLGKLQAWFPWFRSAVSRYTKFGDQALGVPVLRAIALARILLPPEVDIRAPITALGRHLGELSPFCGASEFGYAAVDRETATALGVTLMSDVRPLLKEGHE